MKVELGKFRSFLGPYQLAEKLCFWVKDEPDENGFPGKPEWVHRFGEWLAHGSVAPKKRVGDEIFFTDDRSETWLYTLLLWIDSKKQRKIDVKIDPWDTWSMDTTLGYIVRPMLKQLRETQHGAPQVDIEDVPKYLRPSKKQLEAYNHDGTTDDHFFERWHWVMNEMIFAFESLEGGENQDWEDQFTTGDYDFRFRVVDEDGTSEMIRGENHTAQTDWQGRREYADRVQNGFRLFGKYFQNLWD